MSKNKSISGTFTVARLRTVSGVIIGLYVTMHLLNHSMGLVSVHAQESVRPWIMALWHSLPGQVLLYGSVALHAVLGLSALVRRRHFRMPAWEAVQILLGLSIPYLLLVHVANTRGTRILTGIDIDYVYEVANLWVDPWIRAKQILLVTLVWGHFVCGLHFWLRTYRWYRRAFSAMLLAYVLVPLMALLGFAEVGMDMTDHARRDPAWYKEITSRGTPSDPARAAARTAIKKWVGPAWLAIVAVVFAGGLLRNWLERKRRFKVTFPDDTKVSASIGMSILEVSRMAKRPHMAVCGGRGRCTTCRVWVTRADGPLPPPDETEQQALDRIGAPASLRLACQLKPGCDVAVQPLLNPSLVMPGVGVSSQAHEFGDERVVSILFMDVRGSTQLAEARLPFDVVFLLNHFFAEMADAVEASGGHYSNFTGDGLMALFGLDATPNEGARAALACALGMFEKLAAINQRLAGELATPLAIGVGVHTGEAIVGRMGPPKTPIISALGDAVNTTARLESMTKELDAPIVVSAATLEAAAIRSRVPLRTVLLRGRATSIQVAPLDVDALSLCLLDIATQTLVQKPKR